MFTLEEILAQEAELQFDSFTASDALAIGLEACRIAPATYGKPVAVHIDFDEYPLFTHFMDGTGANNLFWVNVKKNVVKKFGHSSLYVGLECKSRGTTFLADSGLGEDEYRAEGGCFPLVIRGRGRVGTITVSGLKGEEDHAVAVEAIRSRLSGAHS
jgi:uncharacterized protein (UPF0303 family)